MHRAKLAAETSAGEGPQINVCGSLALRGFALGLQGRAAARGGVGRDLRLNEKRRLVRITVAIHRQDRLRLRPVALVQHGAESFFGEIEVSQTERRIFES